MLIKAVLFVFGLSGSSGFSGLFGYSLVQPNKRDKPNRPNNGLLTLADFFSILRGLLRSFVVIDVPNKDCASFVIHEGFDPIPDMSRSIDSSIFVMRHAMFDAIDFL